MLSILLGVALVQANPSAAWGTCLGHQVGRLAAGNASPEAIADQAMRACASHEQRVRRTFAGMGPSGERAADRTVRNMREEMRQLAITTRAQLRGNQGRGNARQGQRRQAAPAPAPRRGNAVPAVVRQGRAFDLVNHYNSPVVRFQTNVGNGWTRNWLATQVAPYGRRNLRFNGDTRCMVGVRIVFADQRTVEDRVDFCRASFLNVNGRRAWAE